MMRAHEWLRLLSFLLCGASLARGGVTWLWVLGLAFLASTFITNAHLDKLRAIETPKQRKSRLRDEKNEEQANARDALWERRNASRVAEAEAELAYRKNRQAHLDNGPSIYQRSSNARSAYPLGGMASPQQEGQRAASTKDKQRAKLAGAAVDALRGDDKILRELMGGCAREIEGNTVVCGGDCPRCETLRFVAARIEAVTEAFKR